MMVVMVVVVVMSVTRRPSIHKVRLVIMKMGVSIDYREASTWAVVYGRFVDQVAIDLLLGIQRVQAILPSVVVIIGGAVKIILWCSCWTTI